MKKYLVGGIAFNESVDERPWLWHTYDSCSTIKEALEVISNARKNFKLVSSWIEVQDESGKKIQFLHDVYIDCLGFMKLDSLGF